MNVIQARPAVHEDEEYPAPRGNMAMIQKGRPSNRTQKLITREVSMAVKMPPPTLEYLNWLEQEISFNRTDHPLRVPRPGHSALVVDAQIGDYDMSKVFMDAGSGINLIFANTLRAMNYSLTNLQPTETSFHGIVPGKLEVPLGKVALDVIFGHPKNFRKEKIEFEVINWPSQYHAIPGRPAFAMFMAVPHYAYLMMKMPGRHGIITVKGNFIKSDNCDGEFNRISETFGMTKELAQLSINNELDLPPVTPPPTAGSSFDVSRDTRAHQVHPTDPTKTSWCPAPCLSHRKARSSSSSMSDITYSPGVHQICQVFLGNLRSTR